MNIEWKKMVIPLLKLKPYDQFDDKAVHSKFNNGLGPVGVRANCLIQLWR